MFGDNTKQETRGVPNKETSRTIGFCSGAVSGLVAITPAAGYVAPWSAVIIGIVGGVCCNLATKFKYLIGVDDALDIFAVHGVGGIAGGIMTGVFGSYVYFLSVCFSRSCSLPTQPHHHPRATIIPPHHPLES